LIEGVGNAEREGKRLMCVEAEEEENDLSKKITTL
jgi:hypothetical protein